MKVGTWNLAGRWSLDHEAVLIDQDCDVWLLTEVSDRVRLPGYTAVTTAAQVARRRAWASVLSRRPSQALADPHPASAAAAVDGVVYCSSVLPWRSCGEASPWTSGNHQAKTESALEQLMQALPSGPLVWGGDWNHSLAGREAAGSIGGRRTILAALEQRGLSAPTGALSHRLDGVLSIDHVAAGTDRTARAWRVPVESRLSDHDAYIVEIA